MEKHSASAIEVRFYVLGVYNLVSCKAKDYDEWMVVSFGRGPWLDDSVKAQDLKVVDSEFRGIWFQIEHLCWGILHEKLWGA